MLVSALPFSKSNLISAQSKLAMHVQPKGLLLWGTLKFFKYLYITTDHQKTQLIF